MSDLAVVTVVHGRRDHLLRQQHWLERWAPAVRRVVVALGDDTVAETLHSAAVEVVEVDSPPDRLRLAYGRNAGVGHALACGAEALVFLDVDCLPAPQLVEMYAAHLTDGCVLSGPVTYLPEGVLPPVDADRGWFARHRSPHPARPDPPYGQVVANPEPGLFWSLSFAVTASTWSELGGFHEEYEGYGAEDTDLAWLAERMGIDLAWLGGADAFHQHHPVSDPPVEHRDDILRNGRIFHRRWGTWPMRGWLEDFERLGIVRQEEDEWYPA